MLVSAVYKLVLENPEVLERVARNLWGTSVELVGSQLSLAWQRLTKSEREGIVNETIAACEGSCRRIRQSRWRW